MHKTTESLKRRTRLRKTAAKRKVSKSRSLYAVKKRVMKAKLKSKSKKTMRKIMSPSKKPMLKVKKVKKSDALKIVAFEPIEEKPSCGCGKM
jgi:hypothetical protein